MTAVLRAKDRSPSGPTKPEPRAGGLPGAVWRAYKGKEALRAIFAGDLSPAEVTALLDRWCAWAQRSRLLSFVKLGRTIREHRAGILAAIRLGLSNGRVEGRNATIRLLTRDRVRAVEGFQRSSTCSDVRLEVLARMAAKSVGMPRSVASPMKARAMKARAPSV